MFLVHTIYYSLIIKIILLFLVILLTAHSHKIIIELIILKVLFKYIVINLGFTSRYTFLFHDYLHNSKRLMCLYTKS